MTIKVIIYLIQVYLFYENRFTWVILIFNGNNIFYQEYLPLDLNKRTLGTKLYIFWF